MPHLGMPQAATGSAHTCGVQALPGHRFLFFLASPLAFFLLSGQLLLGPQSSVRRRVRLLSFSGGHFLLSSSFFLVPGLPATRCCECSRHPWGMMPAFAPVELSRTFPLLLVLRLGLNSPSQNPVLLRMFSPSLGNVPAFVPVELSLTFPLLLVPRLGLNSPSHNLGGFLSSAQLAFRQLSGT